MRQAKDPVCGMTVDVVADTPRATHQGTEYFFCSPSCKTTFTAEPARYAGAAVNADSPNEPFKKAGGIPTPKFGSAGSGGAEFERVPQAPDRAKGH